MAASWQLSCAWLHNAPDTEQLLKSTDNLEQVKKKIIQFTNMVVATVNPAVAPDGG